MMTAFTAASTSASSQTITGSEPPSSTDTRLSCGPAIDMTWRPTSVEPVNAIRRTSGWPTSASPMTEPRPVTTFSTPSSTPASAKIRATSSVASGVVAAGLATTALPLASAGATFVPSSVGEVGDLATGLRDRLALLGGQQRGELGGALLDQRGGAREHVRALLDVRRR